MENANINQALANTEARSQITTIFLDSCKQLPEEYKSLPSFAAMAYQSGMFPNIKRPEQAMFILMLGSQIGLNPMGSLMNIYPIQTKAGNTTYKIGYQSILTCINKNPNYDYEIVENSETRCSIQFKRLIDGKMQDAGQLYTKIAEDWKHLISKDNWKYYFSTMRFAFTLCSGVRERIPEITMGVPFYSVEAEDIPSDESFIEIKNNEIKAEIVEDHKKIDEIFEKPVPSQDMKEACTKKWHTISKLAMDMHSITMRELDVNLFNAAGTAFQKCDWAGYEIILDTFKNKIENFQKTEIIMAGPANDPDIAEKSIPENNTDKNQCEKIMIEIENISKDKKIDYIHDYIADLSEYNQKMRSGNYDKRI